MECVHPQLVLTDHFNNYLSTEDVAEDYWGHGFYFVLHVADSNFKLLRQHCVVLATDEFVGILFAVDNDLAQLCHGSGTLLKSDVFVVHRL